MDELPREPEHEAKLAEEASDADFEAYGAWLTAHGHPRGELIAIAIDLARARLVGGGGLAWLEALQRAEREHLRRFADALDAELPGVTARWHLGFWRALTVVVDKADVARIVASPSAIALRELTLKAANPLLDMAPVVRKFAPLARSLRVLTLDNSLLSSVELFGALICLPRIEELSLHAVTVDGLARLEELPRLRCLSVGSSPQLRDDAVEALARLGSLARIDLRFTRITAAGFAELRRARPSLEVRS